MIGMGVADKDGIDLLPAQIEHAQGYLRPLPAVEEEEIAFPAYKR
jgi:hypothetical protein